MTSYDVQPVKPFEATRILPMNMPSYNYRQHSCPQFPPRVTLATIKTGIYRPDLPTYRRMDMDSVLRRLPDEHSRTSTVVPPNAFEKDRLTFVRPIQPPWYSLNVTDTGRALQTQFPDMDAVTKAREDWNRFLDRCPERYDAVRLTDDDRNIRFEKYKIRYLKPEVTSSWQYKLRAKPSMRFSSCVQNPIPANILQTHRPETSPPNITSKAWIPQNKYPCN